MGDVYHEDRAAGIGSFPELLEIDGPAVCGSAGDDHLRLCLDRKSLKLIVVDKAVVVHTVRYNIEIGARDIGGAAVCQMSALAQVHAHQGIAGFEDREFYRQVGLRAGVRLDIRVLAAEELLRSLDCQRLDLIDDPAAAVIALSGIPFRVFIGQGASHSSHNRLAGPVLGSDQLNVIVLSLHFFFNGCGDLRICQPDFFDGIHKTSCRYASRRFNGMTLCLQ